MGTIQKIHMKIKQLGHVANRYVSGLKLFCDSQKGRALAIFLILCISIVVAFFLGRLSMIGKSHLKYDYSGRLPYVPTSLEKEQVNRGDIVASKKGSKYHYVWCPGAQTIAEKNKRWFTSIEDAQGAGLQPAGNCPGLQ